MAYERELEIALRAASGASEGILEVYQKDFDVHFKADASPVTEADLMSSLTIEKLLRAFFPEDGFISEEMEDDGSRFEKKRFWVVDPLDGTKEFVKKNGEFAINIGLIDEGVAVLGIVFIPVTGTVYYAIKGQGAFRKDAAGIKRLMVSKRENPIRLLVSRSHPSPKTHALIDALKSRVESVREMGSSIKGCLIASGDYDVYYNYGTSMKWDTCALECIVREAGGLIKRLDGEDIDYLEKNKYNRGFYIINSINNYVAIDS